MRHKDEGGSTADVRLTSKRLHPMSAARRCRYRRRNLVALWRMAQRSGALVLVAEDQSPFFKSQGGRAAAWHG
jgi:hypothetical protein